jgi:uncharacterized membrane protein
MKDAKTVVSSAIAGAIALCSLAGATQAYAAHENEEKCAGIVRAGLNDCATSQTACHGSVTVDRHAEAWIYVPKGTCDKIAGAHITNQLAPDEVKAAD